MFVGDFFTYHSEILCEKWNDGLSCLKELANDETILDVHFAFQGEETIITDAIWNDKTIEEIAKEGLLLLTIFSGLEKFAFFSAFDVGN